MMAKTKIYTSDAKVILANVSCTDPDRTEKFTKLNYTVYAAPSSVNVSIDQSGNVMLTEKVPINLKSFDIFVTVQNIDFVVYSNFSVSVINDVPSCSVSKNVLLLWESKPTDVINVTCETVDPGNVHSINYTGFDISFQDLFNVSMISNNNKTVLVNVTIRKYSPAVANITLYLDVNQIQTETSLTVFLSNPPKFLFYYKKVDVMQNLTTGSAIVNISATSDNSPSVLNYSLTSISVDGSPSQYFTIDEKGSIKILQPITNELIGPFNLTVQVKDTLTNLTDSATVEVNILDVNESPVCVVVFNVTSVYTTANWAKLAHINCTDPDKYPEFTELNYTVNSAPSTVNVSIDKSGTVMLADKVPVNVTRFIINIAVQNFQFVVYSNFSVHVINDVPSCTVSKPVLGMWESNQSDVINMTCETVDPGNVHNISYSGFNSIPQDLFNVSLLSNNNNKTVLFNVTLWKYYPAVVNMTLFLYINDVLVIQNVRIILSNPPKFPNHYMTTNVTQNVTTGTAIVNMSATTNNSQSVLNYSLTYSSDAEGLASHYFTVDERGSIKILQSLPNYLVGMLNLTIQVKDTLTNLTDSATVEVNILDVNESPVCVVVFNVTSVYTTANWTKLAHINCTDPDKYPEYTKLNYSVKTVPSTVNVLIDKSGIVNLTDKAPINLPSFDIFVTVQNIEFMLYFNFNLKIISTSLDGYFEIDNDTGILRSISNIPNSLVGSTNFTIKVNDTRTGLSSSENFTIEIEDVNEPPVIILFFSSFIVGQSGPFIVGQSGPFIVGQSGPFIVSQSGPSTVSQSGPFIVGQSGPFIVGQSGSFIVGQSGPFIVGQSGPFIVGQSGSFIVDQSGPFIVGQSGPFIVGQSGPFIVGQSGPSIVG
ncbi:hypothetical protein Btru_000430 [Bulinus truncatus]|nr:hypothetical protein Btru_000430 [Bulinus truncatus]